MKLVSDKVYLHEIACQCGCGFSSLSLSTLEVADAIRETWDHPISFGCVCLDLAEREMMPFCSGHLPRLQGDRFEASAISFIANNPDDVVGDVGEFVTNTFPSIRFTPTGSGYTIDSRGKHG